MKAVITALLTGSFGCTFIDPGTAAEPAKFTERVLYSFCSQPDCADGSAPTGLIALNGALYGTTANGGGYCVSQPEGCGTVFSLDSTTGAETVLYSFCSDQSCGIFPNAGLIKMKGWLYGTVYGIDGYGGNGAVFAVKRKTGTEKVVYSFGFYPDAAGPNAGLIDVNGTLYDTTYQGGANTCGDSGSGCGTVFSLDPSTGAETVLYSFCSQPNCTDGTAPRAGLIDVNGTFYGTSVAGGANYTGCEGYGCGTVFSVDPNTGAEKVIYSFCSQANCTDGAEPFGSLIWANGNLYGTTWSGGSGGTDGTVFSLDPSTGAETVLYSFCGGGGKCTDGAKPQGSLIDVKGTLYGTTTQGGNGGGTVFSIDPNTGAKKLIYSFCSQQNCTDGAGPSTSLIDVDGTLYGTTYGGGLYGYGTAFTLKKKT
jgi:uncharacterized repeat protein (TIGR03803 family)